MPTRRALLSDFILVKTVGKGSFGKVVMVRRLRLLVPAPGGSSTRL